MTKQRTKAAPPALLLKAISKSTFKTTQSASQTPPTKEKENKKIYSADNFPLKQIFLNEYLQKNSQIFDFIGEEGMKSFSTLVDKLFFNWLNLRQNSEKMVYEIKREFMRISEAVLLFEVTNEQRRLTPHGFVIGPFQKYLEDFAKDIEPFNLGIITYSRPLCNHSILNLEDTKRQIREDDMILAGVEDSVGDGNDDEFFNFDVSSFFCDLQ
jgi:hypothetical protein